MTTTLKARILASVVGGLISIFSAGAVIGQQADYVPDQVIVQLTNGSDLAAVAAQYGLSATPLSQVASPAIYLMHIDNGQAPPQVAAALSADARVIFAE